MQLTSRVESAAKECYPEQFVRPFTPLTEELRQGLKLIIPRFGKSPRLASLEVNENCNMDCLYCNKSKRKGKEMTTEEVFNVLINLAKVGIQRVDLTGGEPTLRPDLPQIISFARGLGILPTLSSNGRVRQRDVEKEYRYWHSLAESGLYGVCFSYDGIAPKNDPRVIHLAAFAINTLHIYSAVRTVVTQDNLDKVPKIGEICMLNNIPFEVVPAVALNGKSSASIEDFNPLNYLGRQRLIEIIHELDKVRGPFARFLRTPNSYLNEVVNSPDPNSAWHCKNPSSHWVSIDARGNARVCNDRGLPEIWSLTGKENPLLTKEFHEAVKEESMKCRGCSWFCHWEGNRNQLRRVLTELRFFITIGSLT